MYNAFIGCTGLRSITIPCSVDYIGYQAFCWCNSLVAINVLSVLPPSLIHKNAFNNTNNCQIYVPYESFNAYKTATNWNYYENRIFPMAYKTILSYNENANHWFFIASPLIDSTTLTAVESIITETEYDLYQFNLTGENGEWENYKVDSFNIVNGQGYLYANSGEVNIIFKGEFNEDETKEISLDYDVNAPSKGWNLVGNPFPCYAYINKEYYVMNEAGTAINPVAMPASTPIPPCTGVFVKAETEGETVVFSRTSGAQK